MMAMANPEVVIDLYGLMFGLGWTRDDVTVELQFTFESSPEIEMNFPARTDLSEASTKLHFLSAALLRYLGVSSRNGILRSAPGDRQGVDGASPLR